MIKELSRYSPYINLKEGTQISTLKLTKVLYPYLQPSHTIYRGKACTKYRWGCLVKYNDRITSAEKTINTVDLAMISNLTHGEPCIPPTISTIPFA